MNRLQHTPEGFRDIYGEECASRRQVLSRLTSLIRNYGYDQIETPTVEFFDIFGRDIGTTPSRELYKFFDRDGNTIVLRPDFTPPTARAASTYFNDVKKPVRLYYQGNTFINSQSLRGRLRESTQLGAELIGEGSMDSDAEIISLVCRIFQAAGINDFKISITHADFFYSLIREAGFNEEEEERIHDLISNRNYFGLEELLEQKNLKEDLNKLFLLMGPSYIEGDSFSEAIDLAAPYPEIQKDLIYLRDLLSILDIYGVMPYISIDLGQVTNYRYYTGVIFSGYTFGTGEPVVKGGRYDSLLSNFGKDAPAIGFGFEIDELLQAMSRQGVNGMPKEEKTVILYDEASREKAIQRALGIREGGKHCELFRVPADLTEEDITAQFEGYHCIDLREGK